MESDLQFFYSDVISPKVQEILSRPQYKQRTTEWYQARDNCISASDIASALLQTPEVTDYYIESYANVRNKFKNLFLKVPEFEFKLNPKASCNLLKK